MFQTGRISGILLPVFSLRSQDDFGIGDFGAMPGFMRWLQAAGQKLWMLLPLLPTAPGDSSPYATRCAFGLNPLFIHLGAVPEFADAGGLKSLSAEERATLEDVRQSPRIQYEKVFPLKWAAFRRAFARFEEREARTGSARAAAFEQFLKDQASWLDSYVLYAALSADQQQRPWWEWPTGLRERQPAALASARERLQGELRFQSWLQWLAETQWKDVRQKARETGVLLCGDEPFIIGQDSADVWANPSILRRDARLGVPPDDFSATGQDWGLPYFDFAAMEHEQYGWLKFRAKQSAGYYDIRRVDHAVGYFRQYIRDEQTPHGRFVPPDEPTQRRLGEMVFRLLSESAGIVSEDLGVIPPFVRETLTHLGLPGYRVMRWERDGLQYRNPHEYPATSLATTGTHDTETVREWWERVENNEREAVAHAYPEFEQLRPPPARFTPEVHTALLAAAENSKSDLCVLPWQDVLGSMDRVNLPGSMSDANWAYRIEHPVDALLQQSETKGAAEHLGKLTRAGHR